MGVDIGVKKQTPEIKKAYETLYKTFGSRECWYEKGHPLFELYYKISKPIRNSKFIEKIPEFSLNGNRWFNFSIDTPDYIPFTDSNDNILQFKIKEQVLFTEEIKQIIIHFDKIYLKLYPNDKFVLDFSKQLHYLVDNQLMLILS